MRRYLSEEQFDEVMTKLFDAVGKKFHSIGRSCRGKWFLRSEWTQAQEMEFEKWLKNFTMKFLHVPSKRAEGMAKMFCFNYGWKYKIKNHMVF